MSLTISMICVFGGATARRRGEAVSGSVSSFSIPFFVHWRKGHFDCADVSVATLAAGDTFRLGNLMRERLHITNHFYVV